MRYEENPQDMVDILNNRGKNSYTYMVGGEKHTVQEFNYMRTGIRFVLIPGGEFMMRGEMTGIYPFYIAKYEITQGQWERVMGTRPWAKTDARVGENYPASNMSWNEAKRFCDKLDLDLPTEEQWEYAYRAGTTSDYYWGDERVSLTHIWCFENAWDQSDYESIFMNDGDFDAYSDAYVDYDLRYAHEVGLKLTNAFGLHDMAGNVCEWCEEAIGNSDDHIEDRVYDRHVYKGGGYRSREIDCSATWRPRYSKLHGIIPAYRSPMIGIRPVKNFYEE